MKGFICWAVVFLAFLLCAVSASGAETREERTARAAVLLERGEWRAAIMVLDDLLQSKHEVNANEDGLLWNSLGVAHQYVGEYQQALRSFETGLNLLKRRRETERAYAEVLDNLASLEFEVGQNDAARKLRLQAREIYKSEKNMEGLARVSVSLALIDVRRGKRREADRFVAEAFRDIAAVREPNPNEMASIYAAQCLVSTYDGNLPKALSAVQRAIDLWLVSYGPNYYLLGYGYNVRAEVYGKLGEYEKARADFEHSLEFLSESAGKESPSYLTAEVGYAEMLRNAGSREEATRLEDAAKAKLEELRHRECAGCMVSARAYQ